MAAKRPGGAAHETKFLQGAERMETARWAVLAKESDCRDGRKAAGGLLLQK